jgi:hypothetical protein
VREQERERASESVREKEIALCLSTGGVLKDTQSGCVIPWTPQVLLLSACRVPETGRSAGLWFKGLWRLEIR